MLVAEPVTPLISVVIPTFRRPELLRRAITSALLQTFTAIEIIVVIDGPEDNVTAPQLLDFNDVRLHVHHLSHNGGPSAARNSGVALAVGTWIAFLDDDDEWLPAKLAQQILTLQTNSEANIVACRFEEWTPYERRIRPDDFPLPNESMSEYWFCRAGILIPSTFLILRSVLLALPFASECRGNEDIDWLLRAEKLQLLKPQWMNEVLVIYHSDHITTRLSTHSSWKDRYDWLRKTDDLFSPEAITFYYGRICIPEARMSQHPIRNCSFLLRQAFTHGQLSPRSIAYLLIVTFTGRETRGMLRRAYRRVLFSRALL